MITFVNAKINLGLRVVSRRPDGYHNLQTIFYPIGCFNGLPDNPEPFCDVLEITPGAGTLIFSRTGRTYACPEEKDLTYRAAMAFYDATGLDADASITLEKHLPDGAGMGGGSADAAFTLRMLNKMHGHPLSTDDMIEVATRLGADCPFFILNRPVMATGIGEVMEPIEVPLHGMWATVVKPAVSVPTREAFAGISPSGIADLPTDLPPIGEWNAVLTNDFEPGVFAQHPEMADIKARLLSRGALYASMSGSGSAIFGIYREREEALRAAADYGPADGTYTAVCRL